MKLETSEQSIFPSVTFQVETPEGTLFVNIISQEEDKPIAIDLHIGKAGSTLQAWARSVSRLLTIALEYGVTIEDLITELSSQKTDKAKRSGDNVNITSGPEGIYYALLQYRRDKHRRDRIKMGIGDDEDTQHTGRTSRLAR